MIFKKWQKVEGHIFTYWISLVLLTFKKQSKMSSLQDLYTKTLVAAHFACKKVNDVEIVSLCSYLVHCTLLRSKIRVSYVFCALYVSIVWLSFPLEVSNQSKLISTECLTSNTSQVVYQGSFFNYVEKTRQVGCHGNYQTYLCRFSLILSTIFTIQGGGHGNSQSYLCRYCRFLHNCQPLGRQS